MRAAIIGFGPHGHRIAKAIQRVDGLELAAVVDQRVDSMRGDLPEGARGYDNADELWRVGNIDLVCVATNGPSHAPLTVAAIEAGVTRVMTEKPLACSLAECDRIAEAARSHGARVAVDHPRRHAPAYRWLRDTIATGRWGEPRAVWVQRPGIGLGCLATHSFDLARFLLGRDVRRVTGWVDPPRGENPRGADFVDPGGTVVLEMDGGARAVVAQLEDGAGPMSVEIDLTAGRIRLDEKSKMIDIIERDLSHRPRPGVGAKYASVDLPPDVDLTRSLPEEIAAILSELAGTDPMEADLTHGTASIEVLVATYLSHRGGNVPVELPCKGADRELWLPVT